MTFAYYQNGVVVDVVQVDPFTVFMPDYAEQFSRCPEDVQVGWLFNGSYSPPPERPITIAVYTAAVQERLDTWARGRNYDGILSLCTYATSSNPRFAVEGQRGVDLRDQTWADCYQIMADVQAGNRPAPSIDQLLSELPVLAWPA